MPRYVILFFVATSAVALIVYLIDKVKAKLSTGRTPEKLLLWIGFLGGSVGALLGMLLFRHKTRHWYFWIVNLLGLAWQVAAVCFLIR